MVEIIITDAFEDWFDKLSEKDSDAVTKSVDRLEDFGVRLGFPPTAVILRAAGLTCVSYAFSPAVVRFGSSTRLMLSVRRFSSPAGIRAGTSVFTRQKSANRKHCGSLI